MEVDRIIEQSEIEELFARASGKDENMQGYSTQQDRVYYTSERRMDGAKKFKRKALGLCGNSTVKTLDEMAALLYKTNIVDSIDEGKNLVPSLVGRKVMYGLLRKIGFDEVENPTGQKAYKISVFVAPTTCTAYG